MNAKDGTGGKPLPMEAWFLGAEKVASQLHTDASNGLEDDEALYRLERDGLNELPDEEQKSLWSIFRAQFDDLLIKILLSAACVSFLLALSEIPSGVGNDNKYDITNFVEPIVILLILIFNAIIGTWQEHSAENAIEALKKFEPEEAKVVRRTRRRRRSSKYSEQMSQSMNVWSELRTISGKELVVGDLVEVNTGDRVPADLRIVQIFSTTLWIDQSLLTGESTSVSKQVEPIQRTKSDTVVNQDKINVLFSGTTISRGRCRGIVIATGTNTEIGKIRLQIGRNDEESSSTPLTVKLDEFSEYLSKLIMVICIAVWVINIGNFRDPSKGQSWLRGAVYYFKIAVALAVAAIPEGLPAVITTCLALGTSRMARKNAIVRSLPSVETLGCTSVICSDKTGTLTTNQMSVAKFFVCSTDSTAQGVSVEEFQVSGTTYEPIGDVIGKNTDNFDKCLLCIQQLATICSCCNDASLSFNKSRQCYEKVGEATETALVVLVEKLNAFNLNMDIENQPHLKAMKCNSHIRQNNTRKLCLEFTRERKSMGVYVRREEGGDNDILMVKGAPESVLSRCSHVLCATSKGDAIKIQMDHRMKMQMLDWYQERNNDLRCLALAYNDNPVAVNKLDIANTQRFSSYESNLVFVGIAGMLDPPRAEVKDAIDECKCAGIRVVMITGDNIRTAQHIARQVGILDESDTDELSFTGSDLDKMNQSEQLICCGKAKLFARVEPSHKSRIVKNLQKLGEISAMTGDGVNDAPALKRAEIGIAMGSGTAVAKSASDMVLADDNFSTIVAAVREGRAIFNNMKQFIRYLISSNIGEVVCIFLTAALGLPECLIPVQLLWVNLVTDGLPATALGFNPPDLDIMTKAPRRPQEPLIGQWLLLRYMVIGLYVGVVTIMSSCWWYIYSPRGPHLTYYQLSHHFQCVPNQSPNWENISDCGIFSSSSDMSKYPMTMALSTLVAIEMLNALNSLSENQSLVKMTPFRNLWLVGAILLSAALHITILMVPLFNTIFHICPLTCEEWMTVMKLSFPVLLIDESLKMCSRHWVESTSEQRTIAKRFRAIFWNISAWAVYAFVLLVYPLYGDGKYSESIKSYISDNFSRFAFGLSQKAKERLPRM